MTRLSLFALFLCGLLLAGCGHRENTGGPRDEFGSGQGRIYDRGGLPADLGSIALGNGDDGRSDTNTAVKGTPSNRSDLISQPPRANE